MRPMLASAALRQLSPRRGASNNLYPPLRNNALRDDSPARQRLGSFKRKPDGTISYAGVASGGSNSPLCNSEKLEEMAVDISKVNSLVDKIDSDVKNVADETVKGVLSDISAALRLINGNHEGIIKYQIGKQAGGTTHAVSSGMMRERI
jgi:outer membrane murein-binding lipoprotein Lpp